MNVISNRVEPVTKNIRFLNLLSIRGVYDIDLVKKSYRELFWQKSTRSAECWPLATWGTKLLLLKQIFPTALSHCLVILYYCPIQSCWIYIVKILGVHNTVHHSFFPVLLFFFGRKDNKSRLNQVKMFESDLISMNETELHSLPFWQMTGWGPAGQLETLCQRVKEQLVAVAPDAKYTLRRFKQVLF